MEKFKVIDPKGVVINGELKEKGDTITLGKSAERNAFLHFRQIKPVESKGKAESEAPVKDETKVESEAK
jgi:hypothetical protein